MGRGLSPQMGWASCQSQTQILSQPNFRSSLLDTGPFSSSVTFRSKAFGGFVCILKEEKITWRGSLCRRRWWACRGKCRRGAPESIFNLEKKNCECDQLVVGSFVIVISWTVISFVTHFLLSSQWAAPPFKGHRKLTKQQMLLPLLLLPNQMISRILIWISMSIIYIYISIPRWLEKYSTAMCYP